MSHVLLKVHPLYHSRLENKCLLFQNVKHIKKPIFVPRNLSGSYLETTPVKQVACNFKSTPFVSLTPRKQIFLFLETQTHQKADCCAQKTNFTVSRYTITFSYSRAQKTNFVVSRSNWKTQTHQKADCCAQELCYYYSRILNTSKSRLLCLENNFYYIQIHNYFFLQSCLEN